MSSKTHSGILALVGLLSLVFMKWTSVLFSDARGKLGNQVVFGSWKGRPYCRSYIIPTNPNTLKQQANRDWNTKALQNYQANIATDPDAVTAWNTAALTRLISGYNLFMARCRSSKVAVAHKSGSLPTSVETVTYTVGMDLSDTGIASVKNGTTFKAEAEGGDLTAGDDQTLDITLTTAGTYEIFFYSEAIKLAMSATLDYISCHAHWTADEVNGVALPANITPV